MEDAVALYLKVFSRNSGKSGDVCIDSPDDLGELLSAVRTLRAGLGSTRLSDIMHPDWQAAFISRERPEIWSGLSACLDADVRSAVLKQTHAAPMTAVRVPLPSVAEAVQRKMMDFIPLSAMTSIRSANHFPLPYNLSSTDLETFILYLGALECIRALDGLSHTVVDRFLSGLPESIHRSVGKIRELVDETGDRSRSARIRLMTAVKNAPDPVKLIFRLGLERLADTCESEPSDYYLAMVLKLSPDAGRVLLDRCSRVSDDPDAKAEKTSAQTDLKKIMSLLSIVREDIDV